MPHISSASCFGGAGDVRARGELRKRCRRSIGTSRRSSGIVTGGALARALDSGVRVSALDGRNGVARASLAGSSR